MNVTKSSMFPGDLIGPGGFKAADIKTTAKLRMVARKDCELLGIKYKPKLSRRNEEKKIK